MSSHPQSHRFPPSPSSTQTSSSSYLYSEDSHFDPSSPPVYLPTPTQVYPAKRVKVYQSCFDFIDIPSTFDCPPLVFSGTTAMPQAIPMRRNIAPRINLHRASEPASPITIATTLSTHSSPSPSPSRVTIVSDHHNNPDFTLYDENFPLKEHQLTKQHAPPSRFGASTSNPSPTFHNSMGSEPNQSWPVCTPQLLDYTKLQRSQHQHHQQHHYHHQQQQQQQFYQNQVPVFHADGEAIPELSPSRGSASRPSISELDMPATPGHSPVHREAGRPVAQHHTAPKFMRTVSDAEQDELFNPGIAPGTTTHTQPERIADTTNSQLPTLLQQAQSQHLARSAPAKPVVMVRGHSPFRANSPFHPARTQQEIIPSPTRTTAFLNVGAYTTARSQREKEMERDAEALRQQLRKEYEELQQTPNTISPKDAYIEYAEAEDSNDAQGARFSSSQNDDAFSQHSIKNESDGGSYHGDDDTEHSYDNSLAAGSRRGSDDVNMDYGLPIYHQHSEHQEQQQQQQQQFGDHHQHHLSVPGYGWGDDSSSQGNSDGSHHSDSNYELTSSPLRKPADTMANDGAYSCTVLGCSLRFSTASKMSKHRREAHRNNTPLGRDAPIKSLLQGPSRCERTNPTTGKPCNTIFSRPYDLTRHEDTIHNTARQKVRCEICNDEKTFSRYDALTRHKKVKHGIDK